MRKPQHLAAGTRGATLRRRKRAALIPGALWLLLLLGGCGGDPDSPPAADGPTVDTHMHLSGIPRSGGDVKPDFGSAAETALEAMDEIGIDRALVMPPPFSSDPGQRGRFDYTELAEVARKNPRRFAFLGGGGTLNPIIDGAAASERVSPDTKREFEQKAGEIVDAGAAGFAEFTALHLSFQPNHPFISVPPDHPLFLLLADIAAREKMPIDLHMEAVAHDIKVPEELDSPRNPERLKENITAFERLLSHNREARIVWVHAGWDNTGHRTTKLMRRLFEKHPNLYVSVKIVDRGLETSHNPLLEDQGIERSWEELVRDFPDRFVIGSDEFFGIRGQPRIGPPSTAETWSLVDELPDDVTRKVTGENAQRIYRLE